MERPAFGLYIKKYSFIAPVINSAIYFLLSVFYINPSFTPSLIYSCVRQSVLLFCSLSFLSVSISMSLSVFLCIFIPLCFSVSVIITFQCHLYFCDQRTVVYYILLPSVYPLDPSTVYPSVCVPVCLCWSLCLYVCQSAYIHHFGCQFVGRMNLKAMNVRLYIWTQITRRTAI